MIKQVEICATNDTFWKQQQSKSANATVPKAVIICINISVMKKQMIAKTEGSVPYEKMFRYISKMFVSLFWMPNIMPSNFLSVCDSTL